MINTLIVVALFHTALAAVALEDGRITDPKLIRQGYVCVSSKGVLLKDGEINNNFSPETCAALKCNKGLIEFTSCGTGTLFEGTKAKPNPARPFPECCQY